MYLIAVKTLYVKGLPKTVIILSLLSIIDLTVLCYLFVVELNWGFRFVYRNRNIRIVNLHTWYT